LTQDEAITMMEKIIYWVREDPSAIRCGVAALPGQQNTSSLAVPMMLLCLVDQMETMDPNMAAKYAEIADWSVKQVLAHIQVLPY